ncbi:NINE protein [Tissierella pigra]|uniref:NINE protein n=1 Tax=Tissierella pigra TaxID=2607614 RepID=A0A6N7XRP3_9FIRM|nr:tellurite resistance TerB C-terminal domain-containing protein [Tissierella pigra]MBU5427677.1 NINE protein [Tissierella pigra]MSU00427.1 NINE protein [Tissierella pigra]
MQISKKTNYFVSVIEFKEINKNPFIAGLLSIFLGIFGVHRFYLKRKLTGFIFCIIVITSLQFGDANIVAILLLLSFIEGVIYIIKGIGWLKDKLINNSISNNEYMDKLQRVTDEEKINMDGKETRDGLNEKEKINEIEIIEVSHIEPKKIHTETKSSNKYQNNWTKKLDIPYERYIMEISQVKDETIKFYEKLCNYLDEELRKKQISLNKEIKRILEEGGRYNNILYTIYCISEGHVTKAYSGGYDYYDPGYSYGILEEHLGKDIRDKVFAKAQGLEKNVAPPMDEVLIYFNLTENGLPKKWWDNDGKLRKNMEFNTKDLNVLTATPSRNTIVWDIYSAKKKIISLYLVLWESISNGLEADVKWIKKKKDVLKKIIDGEYRYYIDYENENILASLIKISENTLREVIPNTQILNITNDQENIDKYLPKEVVKDINNKIIEYKKGISRKEIENILNEMIEKRPSDWKLKAEKILMADIDMGLKDLISYEQDENFLKIAKEIIKKSDYKELLLLSLYGIGKQENLSQKNIKLLESIIYSSNLSIYKELVEDKIALSMELLNRLVELTMPIRKKIELDMNKVELSKKELTETVNIVQEYIGENEDKIIETENKNPIEKIVEEIDDKLDFKYGEFLNLILNIGAMKIEDGKRIAMDNGTLLNAFISEVNRELYEYIQDQTIIIDDDYIKIDEFYVDMVRELIKNEE